MKWQYLRFFFVALICFSPLIMGFWLMFSTANPNASTVDKRIEINSDTDPVRLFFRSSKSGSSPQNLQNKNRHTALDSNKMISREREKLEDQLRREVIAQNILGVLGPARNATIDFDNKIDFDEAVAEEHEIKKSNGIHIRFSLGEITPSRCRRNLEVNISQIIGLLDSENIRWRLEPGQSAWVEFFVQINRSQKTAIVTRLAGSAENDDLAKWIGQNLREGQWTPGMCDSKTLKFHLRLYFEIIPN